MMSEKSAMLPSSTYFRTVRAFATTDPRTFWSIIVHVVPTLGLFLQGSVYLTSDTFMSYHADALAVTWEELPPHHQGFVLGVIRGMGAGSISVSLALCIVLSIPFRRGELWARWAVPLVGATFTVLTAYAAYTIDSRTPASTPWRQTLMLTATYIFGAMISYWPLHRVTIQMGHSDASIR